MIFEGGLEPERGRLGTRGQPRTCEFVDHFHKERRNAEDQALIVSGVERVGPFQGRRDVSCGPADGIGRVRAARGSARAAQDPIPACDFLRGGPHIAAGGFDPPEFRTVSTRSHLPASNIHRGSRRYHHRSPFIPEA